MKYISTRGEAPTLGFCDAVLTGLARDGGLYVPETWPQLDHDSIRALAGKPYAEIAKTVLQPFLGDEISKQDFSAMVDAAYKGFAHPAVAPLVQTGPNEFILELFHGPTMAFKDVAMQLLARIVDHILADRGTRLTIVGATSGDTGGAAIEAFRGRDNSDIFILFPHGKVSDVQRWQMTGVSDANVHALSIDGNFDDCQALVKAMFNHHAFRDQHALSGVNSINWARIMAQIVYYFYAALALGAPAQSVAFSVPTGNFGDIFGDDIFGSFFGGGFFFVVTRSRHGKNYLAGEDPPDPLPLSCKSILDRMNNNNNNNNNNHLLRSCLHLKSCQCSRLCASTPNHWHLQKSLAGNVGDMSATRRNVAKFCPDRPILATWFLLTKFMSTFGTLDEVTAKKARRTPKKCASS